MSILKTKKIFTYVVVGALVMALYVSCKSNEEPTGPKAGTNPPAGEYSSITGTVPLPSIPYTNKVTVTHNGNGCTISATTRGYKITGSTYIYQTNSFNITVNSWHENSDGNGSFAQGQGEQITLDKGSMGGIRWYYTDSGNVEISFPIEYDSFSYGASVTN